MMFIVLDFVLSFIILRCLSLSVIIFFAKGL